MRVKPKAYINWSSGKDASMALYWLLKEDKFSVEKLVTTVNRTLNRVTMHGLHLSLLYAQAKSIGIPLETLELDANPSMEVYNKLMHNKVEELQKQGFEYSIFGDIFLEDLRQYREKMLNSLGVKAIFPLWKKDTKKLVLEFISMGFKAVVVSCNAQVLPKSFCGRELDETFLDALPSGVDPCGEHGEYHTFCYDGPCFKEPINFSKGDIVYKTCPAPKTAEAKDAKEYGFWYCDLRLIDNAG